jgi:hypothetical protein
MQLPSLSRKMEKICITKEKYLAAWYNYENIICKYFF